MFRGNHRPAHSTETHLAGSFEQLGHEVVLVQEDEVGWAETIEACESASLFCWTQTYSYAAKWPRQEAAAAVDLLNASLPTLGVHLDLWRGLERAGQVDEEPFFRLRTVATADGDGQEWFEAKGVRHVWSPPAAYGPECVPGTPRDRYRSDVAFIGSWQGYGHPEWWPHRRALLNQLRHDFGNRVAFWPRAGESAVRSGDLNDLLASVKVVVGDSCFADRSRAYFSDRAMEHVGRGGFTVFPYIEALAEMLVDGEHIAYFPPGDFAEMRRVVDHYIAHDDDRERIRRAGQRHVRENHTYAHRLDALLPVAMRHAVAA